MKKIDLVFVLLHLSVLIILFILFYIIRIKRKKQIHYAFFSNMILMFIWCFAVLLRDYAHYLYGSDGKILMLISYFGVCYSPLALMATGIIFARTEVKISAKHHLLLIPPTFSYLILLTNDYHKLFYKNYSFNEGDIVYGSYFPIHSLILYTYVVIGLCYLFYFSFKNSGFFSKQSVLIVFGTSFPLVVNILYSFKIVKLSAAATPISFTFAAICYIYAIQKYNFLNISPIALQKVVDLISDSFVVLNEEFDIIDYNKTFTDTFKDIFQINRKKSFFEMIESNDLEGIDLKEFERYLNASKEERKTFSFEANIKHGSFNKYFTIEFTPIIPNDNHVGTIVLFKDITQSKKDLQTIKEKQAILMEKERLASLGQLIGGIAHNLKTPIMSIAGGIEALKDLVSEYDLSIGDPQVTLEDHREIAKEMMSWLEKMKPHCSYMSDIISTVKGQAMQIESDFPESFTLDEVVKRVELLMKHELKRYHCNLNINFQVDMNTQLQGDINSLVQVFDNIIMNAIHSYNGGSGDIDFNINLVDNEIVFSIRDYGQGIPLNIRNKLFKEMVTTKGKEGTGLGLYMSYINIKGRFGGNISFTSENGKGTTFYVSIPYERSANFTGVIDEKKNH
ncbi:MAG TPA: hypothetical protein GXX20_00245 [Clostridiaceae bacterium]|nr:hypothetical protein [Clostridiaceae bacterium]